MVETKMSVAGNRPRGDEPVNANPRNQERRRRMQVLKDAHADRGTVRVIPANEKLRGVLKHQPSGIAFRPEGGISWPNDRFTQRRLRDGSVKLEPKKEENKKEEKPEKPHRHSPPATN